MTSPGAGLAALVVRARLAWRNDLLRLIVLTLYYLAIVAGLLAIYGTQTYTPPPFIYQGF